MKDLIYDFIAELKAARAETERMRNVLIDGAVDGYCKERGLVVRPGDIADVPDFWNAHWRRQAEEGFFDDLSGTEGLDL
jgi:hypothetical protein